jgi:hypothetical protein
VQRSTTEAELSAASNSSVDLIFWKRLFASLDFDIDHTLFLNLDNLQTVGIVNKEAQAKRIAVQWVPTTEMRANSLTKALLPQKHREFRKQMALVDIVDKITGSELEPSFGEVD